MTSSAHREFDGEPDWSLIPPHMHEGIRAYVEQGRGTGHFLRALLSNDLREAVGRADDDNIVALRGWLTFLWNYAPANCWGSPEVYEAWLA